MKNKPASECDKIRHDIGIQSNSESGSYLCQILQKNTRIRNPFQNVSVKNACAYAQQICTPTLYTHLEILAINLSDRETELFS